MPVERLQATGAGHCPCRCILQATERLARDALTRSRECTEGARGRSTQGETWAYPASQCDQMDRVPREQRTANGRRGTRGSMFTSVEQRRPLAPGPQQHSSACASSGGHRIAGRYWMGLPQRPPTAHSEYRPVRPVHSSRYNCNLPDSRVLIRVNPADWHLSGG